MPTGAELLYNDICSRFFPRWRRWELLYLPKYQNYNTMGFCNVREKKIGLINLSKTTLIHEICHAITTQKHGAAWEARMRKAIGIAQEFNPEMVPNLENEIARCVRETDISNREREHSIIDEVKGDADYYNHPGALEGLLFDCGIIPEYNRRLFEKIREKAMKTIENSL